MKLLPLLDTPHNSDVEFVTGIFVYTYFGCVENSVVLHLYLLLNTVVFICFLVADLV